MEKNDPNFGLLEGYVRGMLEALGEDVNREGLQKTPERVAKSMRFLTGGYHLSAEQIVGDALFGAESDGMVIVKDIELYSLCEHHMLPFFGKAHVAYIPTEKIVGLSKVPRIVDVFARRLQVQERLTHQVAKCLEKILQPRGVAVVTECMHMCMCMRGVQKQRSFTLSSSMLGEFRENSKTRAEFMNLIDKKYDF